MSLGAIGATTLGMPPGIYKLPLNGEAEAQGQAGGLKSGVKANPNSGAVSVAGQVTSVAYGATIVALTGLWSIRGYPGHELYVPTKQVSIYDAANIAIRDVFGLDVYYVGAVGTFTVKAVFTNESESIIGAGEIISTAPMLTIRKDDMPDDCRPKRNDRVSVEGRTYEVWETRSDDSDAYLLMLKAKP